MKTAAFLEALTSLSAEHNIVLSGTLRMRDMSGYQPDTISYSAHNTVSVYGGKDRSGPFLVCSVERKPDPVQEFQPGSAPMIARDYEGYTCPVTDTYVEGRAAHRENLKRTGCRVLEKGEKEADARRRHEENDAATARGVDRAVDEAARRVFNN